jgi:ribosomal protein S21
MIKDNPLNFETLKPIRDGVHVQVHENNIEAAIKALHRRVRECGLLRELRIRRLTPRPQDRKRAKAIRSANHKRRFWARRAEAARKSTS